MGLGVLSHARRTDLTTRVDVRSPDIRERFLDFFASRGHLRLPSAPLVTYDDPSVLFTVAGMVPLKAYILGTKPAPAPRVASCQKCFRGSGMLDDIQEVGDVSHLTFFEMLGNWSFGDYFKEGAVDLAWELLTGPFDLDPARLWPSVHPGDGEAERLWVERIGVPRERISRLEDNWWQAGPTGPCGYDSEIYWDHGPPCSCGRPACTPQDECGGDRWTEIWNLVFMEFDQAEEGGRTPLPRPTVDTGMGLERMSAVLQGVRSVYDTDLFVDIVRGFEARAPQAEASPRRRASLNVLADHLRAACFLIADGVLPGNESRGYVLRRVVRRAAIHGRRVGLDGGLSAGVGDLVRVMGAVYPELVEHRPTIEKVLAGEEAGFARTLAEGAERLEALLGAGDSQLGGAEAFRLHDTFGFPIELTMELARERGVEVDRRGFDAAMEAQRERSRRSVARVGFAGGPALPPTTFVGYETLECEAEVVWMDAAGSEAVIEPSPFYAEAGGQVGDKGVLIHDGDAVAVTDCRFLAGTETRVLSLTVSPPWLRAGSTVLGRVDARRRAQTARHHSATHLLNQALREVLGDAVVQRGSLVEWDHTTFDFSYPRALDDGEVLRVERLVNDEVRRNLRRSVAVLPLDEARRTGAVTMAGERYPEQVRVVSFGDFSKEFCGGTHVERTGDLGAVIITGESSIGQGVRRIEMVVGEAAEAHWEEAEARVRRAAEQLRAAPAELVDRVAALQQQVRQLHREVAEARRLAATGGGLGGDVERVGDLQFAGSVVDLDRQGVLDAGDALFERLGGDGLVVVIGSDYVLAKAGGNARARGVDAKRVLEAVHSVAGGRGGGRPDKAQGGIADPAKRQAALAAVRALLNGGIPSGGEA
jgi:alanyl-tRNA synthetase